MQKIGVGTDAEPGETATIGAKVGWLACKDSCVPGAVELDFEIPVVVHAEKIQTGDLAASRARLPKPLPAGLLETRWEGAVFHILAEGAGRLTFMPTEDCGDLNDLLHDGQGAPLALEFRPKSGTAGPVRGLITLETPEGAARTYIIKFPATVLTAASP